MKTSDHVSTVAMKYSGQITEAQMHEYCKLHGYRYMEMKKLVTIYTDGYADYTKFREVTLPNFHEYAAKHGYEVEVYDPDPTLRVPGWGKLPVLIEALKHYNAALWCDADLLIHANAPDVLDTLESWQIQAMVHDSRHSPPVTICFWLVTREAIPFLQEVWALKDSFDHPNGETFVVHEVLKANPDWMVKTHILGDNWMTESNEGKYLVHADYNRGTIEQRVETLRERITWS